LCLVVPLMPKPHSVLSSLWREAGITTGFTVRGLNTGRGKKFSILQNRPYQLWGPLSLLFSGCRDSVPRVKRPVYEVDHSPPPSAEVKKRWSCTSTHPICLRGVYGDNSTSSTFSFTLETDIFAFFGRGDVSVFHWRRYLLVSKAY
jgi:hypothetical protein